MDGELRAAAAVTLRRDDLSQPQVMPPQRMRSASTKRCALKKTGCLGIFRAKHGFGESKQIWFFSAEIYGIVSFKVVVDDFATIFINKFFFFYHLNPIWRVIYK